MTSTSISSKLWGSCSSCAGMFDKYGCAYKAQEVNDSLDSSYKSAPNEELVKVTTREYDDGDSKTSGSSVEDGAPSSEKGNSQEDIYIVVPLFGPFT
ncbi:hypothetical protein ZWY2020_006176 [Hordeum vulgare]|nr:hypothetical protein ZWY2020_006176 [Hordeum vulgare]